MPESFKISFKLEELINYKSQRNKALTQALAIKAKYILINKKMTCPTDITDGDEKEI